MWYYEHSFISKGRDNQTAEQMFNITGNSEGNQKPSFMLHRFIFLQYIIIAVIIIIIIIIITIIISFMQGIYTYIPQTNCVPGNNVLQLFCYYYLWCLYRYFQCRIYCTFTVVLSEVCVQCPIWLFSVVPWLHVFLVCCSRIFWRTLK